jgi:hypothetical protein
MRPSMLRPSAPRIEAAAGNDSSIPGSAARELTTLMRDRLRR